MSAETEEAEVGIITKNRLYRRTRDISRTPKGRRLQITARRLSHALEINAFIVPICEVEPPFFLSQRLKTHHVDLHNIFFL